MCLIAAAPAPPRYIRVVNQNDLVPRVGVFFLDSGQRFVHLGGPHSDPQVVRYINADGTMEEGPVSRSIGHEPVCINIASITFFDSL